MGKLFSSCSLGYAVFSLALSPSPSRVCLHSFIHCFFRVLDFYCVQDMYKDLNTERFEQGIIQGLASCGSGEAWRHLATVLCALHDPTLKVFNTNSVFRAVTP